MTTPQHNGQGAHYPGRRPRPLKIILNGSNGDRKSKFFLISTSQPVPDADSRLAVVADRTGFHLSVAHSAVRSARYASFDAPHFLILNPHSSCPMYLTFPHPCLQTINRPMLFVPARNRSAIPIVDQLCLHLSPKFSPLFSARSPRSPLLPQYSPSSREIPRVRTSLVTFALILRSHREREGDLGRELG
jgi:hypothetical protein